jgi:3-dehydroquinate dehydratase-2
LPKLLFLNGPNLNLLGKREPEIYGNFSLTELEDTLTNKVSKMGCEVSWYQSNAEAELVDKIHSSVTNGIDFVVINPGAFTHTSIAIRDAFLGTAMPFIEVHISNVYSREAFRHKSYLSDVAVGVISGVGVIGYELGAIAALNWLSVKRK